MSTKTTIEIPVRYEEMISKDEKYVVMFNGDEFTDLFPKLGIVEQATSLDEAKADFLRTLSFHFKYLQKRQVKADCWIPLEWNYSGTGLRTFWVKIFGLRFYFRIARKEPKFPMKGGWFVPLTRLNISFYNCWKNQNNGRK